MKMNNSNSYPAKQFNLSGLNGISDRTLEMHFKMAAVKKVVALWYTRCPEVVYFGSGVNTRDHQVLIRFPAYASWPTLTTY
jgi:hypothetical protein